MWPYINLWLLVNIWRIVKFFLPDFPPNLKFYGMKMSAVEKFLFQTKILFAFFFGFRLFFVFFARV